MRSSLDVALALGFAAIGVFSGVLLIMYSAADDAPGGVLLGILLMIGVVTLSVRTALRRPTDSPSGRGMEERCRALEAGLYTTQSQLDEVQSEVVRLGETLAFTQSLLESRNPAGPPPIPPRA